MSVEPQKFNFRLLVKDRGRSTINVLEYLNKNILKVNAMGVYIEIVKIDEDDMTKEFTNKLYERGIRVLPALLTNDGKPPFLGAQNIRRLMERNINTFERQENALNENMAAGRTPRRDNNDGGGGESMSLRDYQLKSLEGKDDEPDEGLNAHAMNKDALNKRLNDQMRRRNMDIADSNAMASRRSSAGADDEGFDGNRAATLAQQRTAPRGPDLPPSLRNLQAQPDNPNARDFDNIAPAPIMGTSQMRVPPTKAIQDEENQPGDDVFDRHFMEMAAASDY